MISRLLLVTSVATILVAACSSSPVLGVLDDPDAEVDAGRKDGSTPITCATANCSPDATCAETNGIATCVCKPGFSGNGQTCAAINDCAGSPCQNGGNCVDGVNSYTCTCAAGFSGTNCETNVNECANSPCKNGGNCVDGVNVFACTCAAGFSGTTCETNINECAGNPCANGGTCADGVNSFTCTCAAGFTGPTCSTYFKSCFALKTATPNAPDGLYTIDTDGAGAAVPFPVYCDMTNDGGGWTQVYDQDVAVAPNYQPIATWAAGVNEANPNSGQYSILHKLDVLKSNAGSFDFRFDWPRGTGVGSLRWTQVENPLSIGPGAVTPTISNIAMSPASQAGCGAFQGLAKSSNATSLLDGEPNSGCWWFAVGTSAVYGNGIPGYNNPNNTNGVPRARLWMR